MTQPYNLEFKLKVFLLYKDRELIKEIFGLTDEEINKFIKEKFDILDKNEIYLVDYLENNEPELYNFYIKGIDYCKVKFGISNVNKENLFTTLVTNTLVDSLDTTDLKLRLSTIKTLDMKPVKQSVMEKIAKLFEGKEI